MLWARLLAYVTGTVDQGLPLRNEYLAAENRILRGRIKDRLLLSEGEKATLAEIARRLGGKALADVAATAKPDTILGWYRKLIANKFDGSKFRRSVGRPKVDQETERLVVQMARENPIVAPVRIFPRHLHHQALCFLIYFWAPYTTPEFRPIKFVPDELPIPTQNRFGLGRCRHVLQRHATQAVSDLGQCHLFSF